MADPSIVPSTRLDAVNVMLGTIGTAPANTLTGDLTADISLAVKILDRTSREVQSKGWHFNTEKDYPLNRNESGYINVPPNILRCDLKGVNAMGLDVVQRGTRLYERKSHSYVFTRDVKAEVIVGLPYDEMPECARAYIAIKSARTFQAQTVGSDTLDGFTSKDQGDALVTLLDLEGDTGDYSIFDSYDTYAVIDRSGS